MLNFFETYSKRNFQTHSQKIQICPLSILRKEFELRGKEYEVPHERHRFLYKMPDLIDGGCKKLEKQYKDEIVIFFLDEIIAFGNPHSLDWRTLTPGPSINLLLAFSPIGLERGPKQVLSALNSAFREKIIKKDILF